MADCLVTKLKGSVGDATLSRLGEIVLPLRITDASTNYIEYLYSKDGPTIRVMSGPGGISNTNGSGYASSITATAVSSNIYFEATGDYVLAFSDKDCIYRITMRPISDDAGIYMGDSSPFEWCTNTHTLYIIMAEGFTTDIEKLFVHYKYSWNLQMQLYGVTGDLSHFNGWTNLSSVIMTIADGAKGDLNIMPATTLTLRERTGVDASGLTIYANSGKFQGTSYSVSPITAKFIVDLSVFSEYTGSSLGLGASGATTIGELTGTLSDLKLDGVKYLSLKKLKLTAAESLDINEAPSSLIFLSTEYMTNGVANNECLKLSASSVSGRWNYVIALERARFVSGTENFLQSMLTTSGMSPDATATYHKALSIDALDLAEPTSNVNIAVSQLQEWGFTVSITYSLGTAGTSARSARTTLDAEAEEIKDSKYAIVYKEKELIVPPMALHNSTVAAAKDATYAEFDTLEEAEAFVSENSLVLVTSESE